MDDWLELMILNSRENKRQGLQMQLLVIDYANDDICYHL